MSYKTYSEFNTKKLHKVNKFQGVIKSRTVLEGMLSNLMIGEGWTG